MSFAQHTQSEPRKVTQVAAWKVFTMYGPDAASHGTDFVYQMSDWTGGRLLNELLHAAKGHTDTPLTFEDAYVIATYQWKGNPDTFEWKGAMFEKN